MKKKFLLFHLIFSFFFLLADLALSDFEASLNGSYQFYEALRTGTNQYNNIPTNYLSRNNKNSKFISFAENNLLVTWNDHSEYLKKYGANLNLTTRTSNNDKFIIDLNRNYLFLDTSLGTLHLGTDYNVSTIMSYSAYDVSAGTGGASNGDFGYYVFNQFWDNKITDQYYLQKITHLYSLRYKARNPYNISYYTPKMNGFQLGFSFAPDGANYLKTDKDDFVDILSKVKNISSIAVTYNKDILDYSFNFSGSYDKATINSKSDEYLNAQNASLGKIPLSNLSSYTIGTLLKYKQVSFALSKGWSKNFLQQKYISLDTPLNNYKSKFITIGLSYSWEKFLASITYLRDWQECGNIPTNKIYNYFAITNRTKVVSFALDYSLVYGMKIFAEYNRFNLRSQDIGPDNSGSIFILGSKISF
jgi:hypothetical protein